MAACSNPKATKRVVRPKGHPLAYCIGCKAWKSAKQVPVGEEKRNSAGRITATYAPIAH